MKQRPVIFLLTAIMLVAATWLALWFFHTSTQTLDDHVHNVAEQIKCPICQGESVADSSSWLAQEMRSTIREQIQQGRSDQEIMQYFESRYGTQIIWSAQSQGFAILAWLAPLLLLLLGSLFLAFTLRDWHLTVLTPSASQGAPELPASTDPQLALYREQLERELAEDDVLFERYAFSCSEERERSSGTEAQI